MSNSARTDTIFEYATKAMSKRHGSAGGEVKAPGDIVEGFLNLVLAMEWWTAEQCCCCVYPIARRGTQGLHITMRMDRES